MTIAGRERFVLWEAIGARRWEVAIISLTPDGVEARGTQMGVEPLPYRLDYSLDATAGFVTRTLHVQASGEGWQRTLSLHHDGRGAWSAALTSAGLPPLPPASAGTKGLEDARDCDLGLSPMTNLMPVRRHRLIEEPGAVELLVAWIEVPALILQPYRQSYEQIRRTDDGAIVRYRDLGRAAGFAADLELDRDGVVEVYPYLARRVHSASDTGQTSG